MEIEQIGHVIQKWYQTEPWHGLRGRIYDKSAQKHEFKAIIDLIDGIEATLKCGGDQCVFNQVVNTYLKTTKVFEPDILKMIFNRQMVNSTVDFFERAKAFDAEMSFEDIGQAMRNVWIINMIQQLEKQEVSLTDSAFAYSMLYPYTDNLLDDDSVEYSNKKKCMMRFGKRLGGMRLDAENPYEECIFRLVEIVEDEFPRDEFPTVFSSMLAIHRAQLESQRQHKEEVFAYEVPIVELTFNKGGTSVLADAYFVSQRLTESQIRFYCHYGVVLQLCDDLQDFIEDESRGHWTIYNTQCGRPLDRLILKTLAFNEEMVREIDDENWKRVYEGCILMMIATACFGLSNKFSKSFYREVLKYAPVSPKQLQKLSRRVVKLKSQMGIASQIEMMKELVQKLELDS